MTRQARPLALLAALALLAFGPAACGGDEETTTAETTATATTDSGGEGLGEQVAAAKLEPVGGASEASGTATVSQTSDGAVSISVEIDGMEDAPAGTMYFSWLVAAGGDAYPLSLVGANDGKVLALLNLQPAVAEQVGGADFAVGAVAKDEAKSLIDAAAAGETAEIAAEPIVRGRLAGE